MIPLSVASQVRTTIIDYLQTTFSFQDDGLQRALGDFLVDELFKGPYVALRLPFRKAGPDEPMPLRIAPPFVPYAHQLAAFRRLADGDGHTPQPTLITTGTGSGKTECFLYPILDHCHRHRGEPGIKAIILYPMNALATDQAGRLAQAIWRDERLRGQVTAGVYIGGDNQQPHKTMGPDWLIDDRDALRQRPPDILLTNYKMLDFLLLRPEDKPLWAGNGPETLRYLVLDELHTYDGAQGSDVAGLVRRLRARLATPAGWLCPVGTSATMDSAPLPPQSWGERPASQASQASPKIGTRGADSLLRFARDIFGAPFDEASIVREARLDLADFLPASPTRFDLPPSADVLRERAGESTDSYLQRVTGAWFPHLSEPPGDLDPDPFRLAQGLRAHSFLRTLLQATAGEITAWSTLCARLARSDPDFAERSDEEQSLLVESFLAMVAFARIDAGTPEQPRTEPFLTLQVQLWIREMSRLMRAVEPEPAFFWRDDYPEDALPRGLPAYYCRECGHSGWLSHMHVGDDRLTTDIARIYQGYFKRTSHVRYVYTGRRAGEFEATSERLCPHCLRILHQEQCDECDVETFPVTLHYAVSRARGRQPRDLQQCPVCHADNALSIVGSAAASLASVMLSHLFTSPLNQDKKLLAFTDSVQDAAHRAAFFGARTYRFNLRTAIQTALLASEGSPDYPDGAPLDQLTDRLLAYWRERWANQPDRDQRLAATFMPPDLNELAIYQEYMQQPPGPMPPALARDLRTRLSWELIMEYGLNARLGRSLEKVGSSVAFVDPLRLDASLPDLLLRLRNELGLLSDLDADQLRHFVAGLLERTRTRGGVIHPLLKSYVSNEGGWYHLTKRRQPLLSPFHKRSPRFPKFLADRSARGVFDVYITRGTGLTWYLDWARRSLHPALGPVESNEVYRLLMDHLTRAGIFQARTVGGNHIFGLAQEALLVSSDAASLRCNVCNQQYTLAAAEVEQWRGRPCLNYRCQGRLTADSRDEQHYYRALYARGQVERIFSREHTGLLDRKVREALEEEFRERNRADAANLITATPTLEMGIDIGDLSATLATSIPPTAANYLQRIGRAGRKTGNSLVLAQALVRPHDLYFYAEPLEMIAGVVEPPGCFLNAPNILLRHYLAYCMDRWTQEIARPQDLPRNVQLMLARSLRGEFPENFLAYAANRSQGFCDDFITLYDDAITEATRERLREYCQSDEMAASVHEALAQARTERDELRAARASLQQELKRMEAHPDEYVDVDERVVEIKRDMRLLVDLIRRIDEQYILNFFTDAGLLPNYAFPESGVKLRAIISGLPDREPPYEVYEYIRSASTALRELAPFNKFYAQGRKMTVNQIEVPGRDQAFERWQFCDRCAHMELVQGSHFKQRCPKCGSEGWNDTGQQHSMIRLRQVIARDRYYDSLLGDDADEREREIYETGLAFDIEAEYSGGAFLIPRLPFGFEHFRQVTLREMNFGTVDAWGEKVEIAGEARSQIGFRVCPDCGAVAPPTREDDGDDQQVRHTRQCKYQRTGQEPEWQEIYLYREVASEALRILLPVSTTLVEEKLATFAACLGLGLKQYLGGDPSHLQVAPHTAMGLDGVHRRYLVIYDTVPGGTSYLADLAQPENFRAMLTLVRDSLASCTCRFDPNKQACYRCLYSFRTQRELGLLSRQLGLELLQEVLANWSTLTPMPSLSNADMHSVIESELEQRFIDALMAYAEKQHSYQMRSILYKGKQSWVLTVNGVRWRIEPQVTLDHTHGVERMSRADFVFWPLGAAQSGRRPIAVFTDGLAYHAQPGQAESRLPDDVTKRRAIIDSARFWVWSITWDDVAEFAESKPLELPSYFDSKIERMAVKLAAQFATGVDVSSAQTPAKTLLSNACQQLMNYLQTPDDGAWRRYAQAWPLAQMLQSKRPEISRQAALEKAQAMALDTQTPDLSFPDATEPGDIHYMVLPRHENMLYTTLRHADLQAKQLDRLVILLRLEDGRDVRASEHFKRFWRWFWLLHNVFQFTPGFRSWTSTLVETEGEHLLEWVDQLYDEAVEKPRLDDAWQEAYEYSDPHCKPLLESCVDARRPAPVVGYELEDRQGRVSATAELAWPEEKIAVFLPDDPEEERRRFTNSGWQCFDADQVNAIIDAQS